MDAIERGNSVVFFDIALGEGENEAPLGRIKFELFVKDVRIHRAVVRESSYIELCYF